MLTATVLGGTYDDLVAWGTKVYDTVKTYSKEEQARRTAAASTSTPLPGDYLLPPAGDTPWYKNWKVWAGIGGGALVLGTGSYFVLRGRRRRR